MLFGCPGSVMLWLLPPNAPPCSAARGSGSGHDVEERQADVYMVDEDVGGEWGTQLGGQTKSDR